MSAAKHTPGPWWLEGNHDDGIEIVGPRRGCRRSSTGDRPAWQLAVVDNGCFPQHKKVDIANALLMACAPELLAALVEADCLLSEAGHTMASKQRAPLRAVIAKATGGAR